ncbi:MAG TPA: ABC transporter permease subunit [Acidisphaera sp.]|nr:ABC transporter permease subunit [Acidisphaera sp.]
MTEYDWISLLQGALVTVSLSLAGIALGLPLGLGLALIRWAQVPVASPVVATLVSLLRAAAAVTLGLLVFFALPTIGLSIDPIPAAIVTLTLSTCAFNAEIWRGALVDFSREQYDAALSVGMPKLLRFRLIVLPQVVRAAMPALVNEMTLLVKASPAVAVLGVVDITRAAVRIGANTYRPLPPFLAALVIYSLVVFMFVLAQRLVESRRRRLAFA